MCRGLSCSSMVAINHEVRIVYCKGERERTTYCWLCTLHCCPSHARHTCRLSCRPHVCVLSNRWTSEHVIVFARTLQLSSASHFRCCPLLIVSFRDQLYTKFRSSNENIKYLRLYANSMVRAKIYSASTIHYLVTTYSRIVFFRSHLPQAASCHLRTHEIDKVQTMSACTWRYTLPNTYGHLTCDERNDEVGKPSHKLMLSILNSALD